MKKLKGFLIMIFISLTFFSCAKAPEHTPSFEEITQGEAFEIMKNESPVILDVRTREEFDEGHIEGAINLDYLEIGERAEELLPDKDALILVYCRSGRRSKIASEELATLGYTNIKEFGGILDWKYGTVK